MALGIIYFPSIQKVICIPIMQLMVMCNLYLELRYRMGCGFTEIQQHDDGQKNIGQVQVKLVNTKYRRWKGICALSRNQEERWSSSTFDHDNVVSKVCLYQTGGDGFVDS